MRPSDYFVSHHLALEAFEFDNTALNNHSLKIAAFIEWQKS